MSNSSLAVYTKISPHSNPRVYPITKITIHHMAGNTTIENCGDWFAKPSTKASANYGIGTDGRIALYVEEQNRAWTSSTWDDHRSVTIEVANDGGAPDWHVSDKALESLINLCADICKRNGIEKLNYTGDKTGNLTRHNMFAATTCPGPYLQSKFPYIAEEVNKRLSAGSLYRVTIEGLTKTQADSIAQAYANTEASVRVEAITPVAPAPSEPVAPVTPEPAPEAPVAPWTPQVGDIVMFNGGVQYRNANASTTVGAAAPAGKARIHKIASGAMHPYSLIRTGKTGPYGWVDAGTFTKA